MQRHRVHAAPRDELDAADDDAEDEGQQQQQRLLGHNEHDVAANCYLAGPGAVAQLVDKQTAGLVFGFASDMNGVCAIPEETFEHMLAVLAVLHAEDHAAEVLADSRVLVAKKTKRGAQVFARTHMWHRVSGGQRTVKDLFDMSNADFRCTVKRMRGEARGADVEREYGGLAIRGGESSLRKASLFITVHRVDYTGGWRLACVLWVVCDRNFDFVGKLERLCGKPADWRQQKITNPRVEQDVAAQERLHALWAAVLLRLGERLALPVIWRGQQRVSEDPMHFLASAYHPESFYAMTSPCAVYNSLVALCPPDARGVEVEGMAEADLVEPGITQRQYLARYKAWARRFRAIKRAQAAAAAAAAEADDGDDGGADDAAAPADDNDDGDGADDDAALDIVGPDAAEVRAALSGGVVDLVDEHGRAALPALLGWPGPTFSAAERLDSGVPEPSVTLVVDLSTLAPELPAVLHNGRVEFVAGRFGELPPRARVRMQQKLLEREAAVSEEVLLGPEASVITEGKRRKTFVPTHDPLQGYIYDMCDHALYERFIVDVRQRDRDDRLRVFTSYLHNMRQHLRGHLLSGKGHSRVLKTTQLYVDAVDGAVPGEVWASVAGRWAALRGCGDFETARDVYYAMFSDFNSVYWALTGRNLNIVHNFLFSELGWRTGTCGNFKGIGYTVTVMDAAGLTWTTLRMGAALQATQNFKKEGTTGYDLDRKVYQEIRRMYTHVVPRSLLDRHVDDGHIDCSTMRATPGSIGEGMIWIVEGRVEKEPTDNLGTARFFPEGLGDGEVLENCVRLVPRDDNVRFRLQTSADTAQTGVRQQAEKRSVDGFAFTLCSFARNQQPADAATQRRRQDLDRVLTNLPSSGPYDEPTPAVDSEQDLATLMPWEDAATARVAHVALMASSRLMDEATKRQHGGFFAFPMLNGSLAALMQKLGMLPWDVSPPVDWLVKALYNKVHASLAALLSPLRLPHCSRVLDSSIVMAGVVPTALMRSFQTLASAGRRGRAAADAVVHLSQLQYADALHVAMVPAVLMRFLTSMLDFPVLAVLACLFREAEIPVLSVRSVCEFLNAQPVSDAAEGARLRTYVQQQLHQQTLCAASELLGEPHEARNISLFVTGKSARHGASALKCAFVVAENERRDVVQLKKAKLFQNACDVLATQLVEHSQFCKEHPDASVHYALHALMRHDFNLSRMFGSHRSFYDHKRMAKRLMGASRFEGIAPMAGGDFALLRIMPVGGNAIGMGLNLAPSLLLSSLMQTHRRDWDLQVAVAQSVVKFMVETQVPFALLPADSCTMDNFRRDGAAATCAFDRRFRPLQYVRVSHAKVFSTIPDVVPEGSTADGLMEDVAYMQPVLSLSRALGYEHYNDMNLCSWEFDIAWGLAGDVVPLAMYGANAAFARADPALEAGPRRRGWVVVEPDLSLRLCVADDDGAAGAPNVVRSVRALDVDAAWDRREQQRFVFGHAWGPAPFVRRCGALLRGAAMQTLVPFAAPAPAEIVAGGFAQLAFFRDGYYLTQDGVPLGSNEVLLRLLPYGARLALSVDAPGMLTYRARCAPIPAAVPAERRREGWVAARLLVQSSLAPAVGKASVGVRCSNGDVVAVLAAPEHLCELADAEDAEGCHAVLLC